MREQWHLVRSYNVPLNNRSPDKIDSLGTSAAAPGRTWQSSTKDWQGTQITEGVSRTGRGNLLAKSRRDVIQRNAGCFTVLVSVKKRMIQFCFYSKKNMR